MTLSHWQRRELGPSIHCDMAVVGGGIVGASTAYWLKKINPGLRVTLVEAQTLGHGASGRNAGFLLQGAAVDFTTDIARYGEHKARLLWDFTKENRQLIESELNAGSVELKAGGSLILAGSTDEDERLQKAEVLLNDLGESVRYWTAEKIALEIKGVGFFGGLFIPTGARVDSLKLVREIAGRSGAMILEGHPVIAVEKGVADSRPQTTLHTRQRDVIADRVVFCLNAYLPMLLPETGAYIRPVRAQMMATEPLEGWLEYPVYSHEGFYYARQVASGEVLIGGARHLFADEEVGLEDRTTTHLQQSLKDYLVQYFPHIERVASKYEWSGVMAFTEDGLPIFSALASHPGCFMAAGFNGHGMGYGFRFGKMVASALCDQPDKKGYRTLFDMKRFENERRSTPHSR